MQEFDIETGKEETSYRSMKDSLDLRLGFIRKVYMILTAQIGLTAFMGLLSAKTSFGVFQMNHPGLLWFFAALAFITMFAVSCYSSLARKVPTNYILLGIFTFSEAYSVSFTVGAYTLSGYGNLVLWAAFLTVCMTLTITYYAFTTKTDFTIMGGLMFCLAAGLIFLAILTIFTDNPFINCLVTVCGIVVYGVYLIYDTQLIAGGKKHEFTVDDYIVAAMQIYVDIIVLFLEILKLLKQLTDKND